jgi:hypothetical protein
MKLTDQERNSELWTKIKAHFEQRIQKHRASNDKTQAAEETEKLRGRIAELKYLLTLEKPGIQVNEE